MRIEKASPDQVVIYDDLLSEQVSQALQDFRKGLLGAGETLASQGLAWIENLWPPGNTEDYFKHPESFPVLLLPWFVAKQYTSKPDLPFQRKLIYSSVNGYFSVRLIDNLMDGHSDRGELQLLPLLAFFHSQFQASYQKIFNRDHPFWKSFFQYWYLSAESSMKDSSLENVTWDQYIQISAKKTCAAVIPVIATCWHIDRPDLIDTWAHLIEVFGRWHQMKNDTIDWRRDQENQVPTYFLSEGRRRSSPDKSITDWALREGFDWSFVLLRKWMGELQNDARDLENTDLCSYLAAREKMMECQMQDITEGAKELIKITRLLNSRGNRDA